MTYLLDTNAVSALMKGTQTVVDRLAAVERTAVAVPQPVIAEIAFGIERLPRSKRRDALQTRFELICSEIARAEWTDAVSQAYGRLKATLERRGQRIEDFDAAIAAHAIAAEATLVTANVRGSGAGRGGPRAATELGGVQGSPPFKQAEHMLRVPGLRVEDWTR